jgi:small neutral amino acid transporter SnatA (MarC family)
MILISLSANMLITLVLLIYSEQILRRLGDAAARGLTKVIAIFLAAIGIMMIRKGLETILLGQAAG